MAARSEGARRAPREGLRDQRGMSLIELLITMVAAGVVMAAAYQVLLTNQRLFTVQREQILAHQTVRAGSELLFSELREVSAPEGDLVQTAEQQVELRAMRAFGFVCARNASESRLSIAVQSGQFDVGQGIAVFVDNDPESVLDDEWAVGGIQNASDNSGDCPDAADAGNPIRRITTSGLASGDFSGLRIGAPIRAFETYTYGAYEIGGQWYLARRTGTADPIPMVGPLDGQTGLRFQYLDADGAATTTPAEVRRVRVTLRTRSEARDRTGNVVVDSLTADAFLRN
jgi:prepilin-type N-terminal cleavage/methylation domain-containing protein